MSKSNLKDSSRTVFYPKLQPTQPGAGQRRPTPHPDIQSPDDVNLRSIAELKKKFEDGNIQPVQKVKLQPKPQPTPQHKPQPKPKTKPQPKPLLPQPKSLPSIPCRPSAEQKGKSNEQTEKSVITGLRARFEQPDADISKKDHAADCNSVEDPGNKLTVKRSNNVKITNACTGTDNAYLSHLENRPGVSEKLLSNNRSPVDSSNQAIYITKSHVSLNKHAKPVILKTKPQHFVNGSESSISSARNHRFPINEEVTKKDISLPNHPQSSTGSDRNHRFPINEKLTKQDISLPNNSQSSIGSDRNHRLPINEEVTKKDISLPNNSQFEGATLGFNPSHINHKGINTIQCIGVDYHKASKPTKIVSKPAVPAKPRQLEIEEFRVLCASTEGSLHSSCSESTSDNQTSIYTSDDYFDSSFDDDDNEPMDDFDYVNHCEMNRNASGFPYFQQYPDYTANHQSVFSIPSNVYHMDPTSNHNSVCDIPPNHGPVEDQKSTQDNSEQHKSEEVQAVIEEFKTTERVYVQKLQLIEEDFHATLLALNKQEEIIPADAVRKIFSDISSLYKLHCHLLRDLERCSFPYSRNTEMRIGRIFTDIGPFFKSYASYVCKLCEANKEYHLYKKESPKFEQLIKDIEAKPECGNLPLESHLAEPATRVTRYIMLLKAYLKKLPEDSVDRVDAQKALELVTAAANHSCREMKRMDSDMKMIELSRSLSYGDELVRPSRQLIKEGNLITLSKRRGAQKQRYFYLFNDILLICRRGTSLNIICSKQISHRITIEGLKVCRGKPSTNNFYLMGKEEVVEVKPSSAEEAEVWLSAFGKAIEACTPFPEEIFNEMRSSPLGSSAPLWIKDHQADSCMLCWERFDSVRWRHHCRACGHVVCDDCSPYKMKLLYTGKAEVRLCGVCFRILQDEGKQTMAADDDSIMSGFLEVSKDMTSWSQHWFALQRHALFSFNSKMAQISTSAIPLDGYRLETPNNCEYTFLLTKQSERNYYFRSDNNCEFSKWTAALKVLTKS